MARPMRNKPLQNLRNRPFPRTIAYAAMNANSTIGITAPTATMTLFEKYVPNLFAKTSWYASNVGGIGRASGLPVK